MTNPQEQVATRRRQEYKGMLMLESLTDNLAQITLHTQQNLKPLLYATALIWSISIINWALGNYLLILGIYPRKLFGLPGVIMAPFLHADFNHLFFNTIPFIVLSNFIMLQGITFYCYISGYIIIVSGFITWIIGKRGYHVGASGLITGYWTYLLADSYQSPSISSIIVAAVLLYYFIGIFLGLFPMKKGVSWEGHLSGAIAGLSVVIIQNINVF